MISEDISARNIFDAILPLVSEHARFNNNRTNYEGIIETPTTKQSISDTTPTDLQVNLKGDTGTCMQSAIYTRRNVSHPLVKLEIPPTNHIKISTPSVAALSHSVFLSENDLPEKNLSIVSSIETSDTKEAYYTRGTRYGRSSCSEIVPDKPNPADDGNENYVIGHQTGLSIKFFRGARKQRTCQRQRNLDFRFDGPKPSNLGTKEAICLENLLSDWSNSTLFEPLDSVRSNFAQSKCEFLRYPVALAAAMARAQDNSYLTNYYRSGGSSPCSINSERWNNSSKLRLPDQGFLEIDDTHFSFPPSEPDSLASDSHTSLQESQESTSRPRTKAQFNEMCSSAKVYRRKPTYFLDSHSPFLKHKGKPKRTAKVTKRRPYKKNRLLCSFNKRKGRAKKAVITQPCLTLSLRPNKNVSRTYS
ncbi:unnamed protein product [Protopolystoma xenopodis]|uniref:Uncharacterized protein n=1 Tax=Protopolystoma xenopodis TaxID=117903 RepID=A0A3S5AGH3_9PLAT|nr:unnamed protein product [Protopolystoma xenopodis]